MPATLYNYMLVTFSRSMLAIMLATFSAILSAIMSIIPILTVAPKGRCQKKTMGKCGNFEKTGGGSTRIPLPFFTVFNMGDLPKINGKIGKKFPNRGEGVPDLGKIPTFSRFFWATSLSLKTTTDPLNPKGKSFMIFLKSVSERGGRRLTSLETR